MQTIMEESVTLPKAAPARSRAIRERIDSFENWHYDFNLEGEHTLPPDNKWTRRHRERMNYFFRPLVEMFEGTLEGKRVLDLGCNAGYWSLAAIEAGADYVLGVDGRQMHIDQANFVFELKGVAKRTYDFEIADIFNFDFRPYGNFDIVLNLGLMYHISKHVELMEMVAAINDDIHLIDSLLSIAPGSYLRIRSEDLESPRHAVDRELVMSPTKKAMIEMARAFGYDVAVLKPRFQDYSGSRHYRQGRRKAFICAKKTSLSIISAPVEPIRARPTLAEYGWLARDVAIPRVTEKIRGKFGRR